VLRKKKNDGQGGPAAAVDLDVIGVIRHKILFKDRPKALISSNPSNPTSILSFFFFLGQKFAHRAIPFSPAEVPVKEKKVLPSVAAPSAVSPTS
jgi:hypothetical protein